MTANSAELAATIKRLRQLRDSGIPEALAKGGGTVWAVGARRRARVDTGEMRDRTEVVGSGGGPSRGWADIEAGADHSGFQEFGTAYVSPNYFFRGGRDDAESHLRGLGVQVGSEVERIIRFGGSTAPDAFGP